MMVFCFKLLRLEKGSCFLLYVLVVIVVLGKENMFEEMCDVGIIILYKYEGDQ